MRSNSEPPAVNSSSIVLSVVPSSWGKQTPSKGEGGRRPEGESQQEEGLDCQPPHPEAQGRSAAKAGHIQIFGFLEKGGW